VYRWEQCFRFIHLASLTTSYSLAIVPFPHFGGHGGERFRRNVGGKARQ
jgi:hypothetical protein